MKMPPGAFVRRAAFLNVTGGSAYNAGTPIMAEA